MLKKITLTSCLKSPTSNIAIISEYWHTTGISHFLFATTAIRYFLGYLADLGYVGYPIFFATTTILSYFGTSGYPDFNLPHLECT